MNTDHRIIPLDIVKLTLGFFKQQLTDEQHDELDAWFGDSKENQIMFEEMVDSIEHLRICFSHSPVTGELN
ncbi:MAG: hypothetical protein E6H08_21615 [Bacteroidetes bacterium]|nr:MAG: hypothetical protein E6H08_21615 [Bacteroidota bacterium]